MLLPPRTTVDEAASLAAALPDAVRDGQPVLRIDATALQAFDSATLALLLQARRLAESEGRGYEIIGLPSQLRQLAELYGLADLLQPAPAPGAASGSPAPRP